MKISDILKIKGLFSKDIKLRLNQGQMKLNGEVIKEDIEVTSIELSDIEDKKVIFNNIVQDAGDFIFFNIVTDPIWKLRCEVFGFEELFNTDINNDLTDFLSMFNLLKISKKEILVIKK
jgi:hypothetical protein